MQIDLFKRLQEFSCARGEDVVLQTVSEHGRETLTYRQLVEQVRAHGRFLADWGVRPGDHLALLMEDDQHWAVSFLAGYSAGAVLVPLDAMQNAERLAQVAHHADCRFLIASNKFRPQVEAMKKTIPQLGVVIDMSPEIDEVTWQDALDNKPEEGDLPLVRRDPADDLAILYTGGTTGTSKGVRLTENNLFSSIHDMIACCPVTPEDHVLSILPLSHVMSLLANVLGPLYCGSKITYLVTRDPTRVLAAFAREEITAFLCVPQFFYLLRRRILEEVDHKPRAARFLFHRLLQLSGYARRRWRVNLGKVLFKPVHRKFGSRFRLFGVAGARFDPEVATLLRDLGFDMFQAYGMTEVTGPVTVTPLHPGGGLSCGPAMQSVELRIENVSQDGVGQILVRGPHVMKGYWKDQKATDDIIQDGWLRSGDLGRLDQNNCLHVTGRAKDVIVLSNGNNVFPEPLEHFLQTSSSLIQEVCVLGVSLNGSPEEQLHAVVVPNFEALGTQRTSNLHDLVRHELERLSQALPAYQRVHSFEVRMEPLPRTTTRKVQRFQVQQELKALGAHDAGVGDSSAILNATEAQLIEVVRRIKPCRTVTPEMSLELDLGFDSLERVELLANIDERFGVHVSDDQASRLFTVRDLFALVANAAVAETDWKGWRQILNQPLSANETRVVNETLQRRPFLELFFYGVGRLLRVAGLLLPMRAEGQEQLPKKYPYILCVNHASHLDVFLLAACLPFRTFCRLFFLGASKYAKSRWMTFIWKIMRGIKVDADQHLTSALRFGAEGLRRGLVLCIYPEGRRTTDGSLRPFKKGAAILATELGVPVIPVGISGTFHVWRPGTRRIRLHPVRIRFGRAIQPVSGVAYEDFIAKVQNAVAQLLVAAESTHGSDCRVSEDELLPPSEVSHGLTTQNRSSHEIN